MNKGFFGFEDIIGTGGWAIITLVFLATIGGGGAKLLTLLMQPISIRDRIGHC